MYHGQCPKTALVVVTNAAEVSNAVASVGSPEKQKIHTNTRFPLPTSPLPPQFSCPDDQRQFLPNLKFNAKIWAYYAFVYWLQGVDISKLSAQPKPCISNHEKAIKRMAMMADWESDACSVKFCDEKGTSVLAYFARCPRSKGFVFPKAQDQLAPFYHPGPFAPSQSQLGCSEHDVNKAEDMGTDVQYDGIPFETLEKATWASQVLYHSLHPHKVEHDGHHDNADYLMQYKKNPDASKEKEKHFTLNDTVYTLSNDKIATEQCGVSHLIHCWPEQGQKHPEAFHPLTDILHTATSHQAMEWYFQHTEELAIILAVMFEASFPAYYKTYKKAFEAGQWIQADPGPWLGCATVWRLQVLPHRNGLDAGPTAIFSMGQYTGGEAYITDLKLKFKYHPGVGSHSSLGL
ncbi:hypothetical protein DFH29DRAFT_1000968 [Suillus ampliporus]|nr:hypothetical protein DFH29DRAFT_1000968 [Suillus ampliporus]